MPYPTIFVAIASYRDPECQHTVRDLFLKAEHPKRITVGICWQFEPYDDLDCFQVLPPFPGQVREEHHQAAQSQGSCWARKRAHKLWRNEEYILQIDAHMRFVDGWDTLLIDTLERCPSTQAALSTAPMPYWPPDHFFEAPGEISCNCVSALGMEDDLQPVHLQMQTKPAAWAEEGPQPNAFIVANFLFGPACMFFDVPYDPYIYFRGQELTYAARLWTHGWDVYQPDRIILYHYWDHRSRKKEGQDYKLANKKALLAWQRVCHLLELFRAPDEALIDIGTYGMGSKRTLLDYWTFAGVNLKRKTIEEFARRGEWEHQLSLRPVLMGT